MTDATPPAPTGQPPASTRRRGRLWVAAVALTLLIVVGGAVLLVLQPRPHGTSSAPATGGAALSREGDAAVPVVSKGALATLPEARYDAVIGGLVPYTGGADTLTESYRLTSDVPVFGADRRKPVARLASKDFVGASTTVVVVERSGAWALVLTPSRVALPSTSGGNAPPQSAGWVAASELSRVGALRDRIVISVAEQRLTILHDGSPVSSFAIGVGTPGTPTPTGVTGYLQQRYLDARQGETVYPIQLTSLHASTTDEPYGGDDGGLIGIHYNEVNAGAVSHGCVRLTQEAITAVNDLPLGTPITITD